MVQNNQWTMLMDQISVNRLQNNCFLGQKLSLYQNAIKIALKILEINRETVHQMPAIISINFLITILRLEMIQIIIIVIW